jgi:tetratricopeptide (TPR) repeat protein
VWAYDSRGLAYKNKGDYTRARADWERALRLDPGNIWVQEHLEVLRQMGY